MAAPRPFSNDLKMSLAPTGKLRVPINLGNPILANWDYSLGKPFGISVDLANELALRLGLDVEFTVLDALEKCTQAFIEKKVDLGFFPIEPSREPGIQFTPAYILIEGAYLVRKESPIQDMAEVDMPGNCVVVGKGSVVDLFLTQELKNASITRVGTTAKVVDQFLKLRAEVVACGKQQLEADMRRFPGLRLLNGRFMVINEAIGLPEDTSIEALHYMNAFVEDMKRRGFVDKSMNRHGIIGAMVAPAGYPI